MTVILYGKAFIPEVEWERERCDGGEKLVKNVSKCSPTVEHTNIPKLAS